MTLIFGLLITSSLTYGIAFSQPPVSNISAVPESNLFSENTHVVIDFEKLQANKPGNGPADKVFHQYEDKGIILNNPVPIDYSDISGFAHSGVKAVEQCYGKEFCTLPFNMSFTAPQRLLKVWVGYREGLQDSRTVILRAFDIHGTELAQATTTLSPNQISQPVIRPLEVNLQNPTIEYAIVSYSPNTTLMNNLVIDDIEFERAGPFPACLFATNPTITLNQPQDGITVHSNEFILQGTITTQNPLEEASVITTGRGNSTKVLNILAGDLLPRTGGNFGPIRIDQSLIPGSNTVSVKVRDCHAASQSDSKNLTYTLFEGARYTIHVNAILATDNNGDRRGNITPQEVKKWIDGANINYAPVGVQFAFDPNPNGPDWSVLPNTRVNSLSSFINPDNGWNEANAVASQHRGKLVLFLCYCGGPSTGSFSFPPPPLSSLDTNFIAMSSFLGNGNGGLFAHESGHYLGLYHTFPGWSDYDTDTPEKAARYIASHGALDGDGLADSSPDGGGRLYDFVTTGNYGGVDRCNGPDNYVISGNIESGSFRYTITPDKHNVMSYFGCEPNNFTPMQADLIRRTLVGIRAQTYGLEVGGP